MEMLKTTLASYPGSATVDLNAASLTFSITDGQEEPVELGVDLLEVVSKHSQDHGVIAVGESKGKLLVSETTAISVAYRGSPFADTHNTARRDSALAVYRSLGGTAYPAVFILTPYRGCSFEECVLYFFESNEPEDAQVTVNGQALVAQEIVRLADYLTTWLPISLVGPSSVSVGQHADITVSCPDNVEVHLEATAGVISRSRARNGDVVHLDLSEIPAGTTARVKAGYKFWPGKVDYEITVQ
jgi:hypothetical protein